MRRPRIAPRKSTSKEPMAEPQRPSAAVTTTAKPPTSTERVADWQPSCAGLSILPPSSLIADDLIATDDSLNTLVPMLSTRTTFSNERVQKMFERYGIKFEPRTTGRESGLAHDVRRVEKPIRVRVHFSCQECGTAFNASRICTQCGHRRCRECPRNPPKRIREVLDGARQQQLRERQRQQEQAQQESSEPRQPADNSIPASAVVANDSAPQADSPQLLTVEQEGVLSVDPADSTRDQYVVQSRPCAGVQLLLRATAQLVRRICHECQTHFEPANPSKCQTCNHIYCELCQYETLEAMTQEPPADDPHECTRASPRVPTVQRVYKKPRQRVRWTCDQCEALFTDRDTCQECGHRKCEDCIRSPYAHTTK